MSEVEKRLEAAGHNLPDAPTPVASFVPFVKTGNLVFMSGQVPQGPNGFEYQGKVGDTISEEDAIKAAELCIMNMLAQLKVACDGDLDRVTKVVKLGGFVNSAEGYVRHPIVINAASELLITAFGDAGRHARFALGALLPFDVSVEIDGVFEIA
ncbi:RidA family protein [uncultured Roseobacter sp.]|uniref:RidA family protein n=1 Tax=uncultured Roseobacter sp. TaxID=114847 RepID=UPI00260B08F2|nr:RidA family protein [uncultured Roseobacter sp.]